MPAPLRIAAAALAALAANVVAQPPAPSLPNQPGALADCRSRDVVLHHRVDGPPAHDAGSTRLLGAPRGSRAPPGFAARATSSIHPPPSAVIVADALTPGVRVDVRPASADPTLRYRVTARPVDVRPDFTVDGLPSAEWELDNPSGLAAVEPAIGLGANSANRVTIRVPDTCPTGFNCFE